MMKRSIIVWLVVGLLLTSLACSALTGGGGGGGSNGGGGSSGTASGVEITIENRSPDEVCYVLISPSSDDSWGDDQLGGSETIAGGDSRSFAMDEGTYDVQAMNCDEAVMATAWEVSRDTTVTVGSSGADVRLLVSNDSDTEVCYIFISPTNAEDWGEDRMGDMESLPPDFQRIFYVEPGFYDLQAADCEEETLTEEYEVDLNSDLTWSLFNR